MQLVCTKCNHTLEFSGKRPSFCGYCGQALEDTQTDVKAVYDHEVPTQVPSGTDARELDSVPQVVGGYRLRRPLGCGGMGTVYEAEEIATGRKVALKLTMTEYAASAEAVERFRQEGRLASMVAHSRCVFVLSVGEEAGRPYIVMELMTGSTLKDLVDQHGPLPPEEAIAKILDVIEGLQAAHRLDVIHRDVKPSNCFLEADGRVKVGDFGLAKSVSRGAHLTKSGTFLGTPHFASPEQVRGDPIDPRTDVYSVAATLYYLLTGQPPFPGNDAAATLARIVSDPAPSVLTLRPEVPAALDRVILRGLERDRERRWQDLEELRQALLPFLRGRLLFGGMGWWLASLATRLAWPEQRRTLGGSTGSWLLQFLRGHRLSQGRPQAADYPERLGRFAIPGALKWTAEEKILFGEDATLGRKVLIRLLPGSAPPLDQARQDVGRATRLRWVAQGEFRDLQWDAFLAPSGSALPEVIADEGKLSWTDVYPLLQQLADELAAACADGTLPASLSVEQVWVQPDGRAQLTDGILTDRLPGTSGPSTGTDQERSLALLREVAVLALEGHPRKPEEHTASIRAPVPLHARPILDRLAAISAPYTNVQQVQADLASLRDKPTEITRPWRAEHVALLAGLHLPGLLVMSLAPFWASFLIPGATTGTPDEATSTRMALATVVGAGIWPLLWVVWAFLFHGGLTFRRLGIAVVRSDGQPASRLRCAARALVVWAPVLVILASLYWMAVGFGGSRSSVEFQAAWMGAWRWITVLLFLYLLLALVYPPRALHDRLAGTFLVPR
jgi:hypothetical protein